MLEKAKILETHILRLKNKEKRKEENMKFVHIADIHFDSPFINLSDRENLGDIKETIYNVLENCYTSSTIKDTAIWGSDEFIVLGPECWAANFSIQGRTVIYIDKTSSTKINCYYKDGCEGLATTLYQSFNDSRLVGGFMIMKLKTVYEQTYIRLPNTIVSDWRYGKDYIKDLELDSNSISDVLGQSYWE